MAQSCVPAASGGPEPGAGRRGRADWGGRGRHWAPSVGPLWSTEELVRSPRMANGTSFEKRYELLRSHLWAGHGQGCGGLGAEGVTLEDQLGYYRGENLELVSWGRRGRLRERLGMRARVDGTMWSENFTGRAERRRSSEIVAAAPMLGKGGF